MMVDPATTRVTTSDTSDGVAVAFTTTSDVNELRARVRHMADMHNQVAGMREGATGGEMPRHEHMKARHMVPSRATAEDIPGGARMVLVPADPSQLAALRDDARTRADMMQKGQCPMMAPERA